MVLTGLKSRYGQGWFLLEALGKTLFSCLSQLLGAPCLPWLMVLPSSSKPEIIGQAFLRLHLSNSASDVTSPLMLPLSSFPYKHPCDYTEPIQIIQDDLHMYIWKSSYDQNICILKKRRQTRPVLFR